MATWDGQNVSPLRYWVHVILPLVYDDSLSYYEVLSKVAHKMNEVIESVNKQNEEGQKLADYLTKGIQNLTESFNNFTTSITNRQENFEQTVNTTYTERYDELTRKIDEFLDSYEIKQDFGTSTTAGIAQKTISESTMHDGRYGYINSEQHLAKVIGEKRSFNDLPNNQVFTFTYAAFKLLSDGPDLSDLPTNDNTLIKVERIGNVGNTTGTVQYIFSTVTVWSGGQHVFAQVYEARPSDSKVIIGWYHLVPEMKQNFGTATDATISQDTISKRTYHDGMTGWLNSEQAVTNLLGDSKSFNDLPNNQMFTCTWAGFQHLTDGPDLSGLGLVDGHLILVERRGNVMPSSGNEYVWSRVTIQQGLTTSVYEQIIEKSKTGVVTPRIAWHRMCGNIYSGFGNAQNGTIDQAQITKRTLNNSWEYINADNINNLFDGEAPTSFNDFPVNQILVIVLGAIKDLPDLPDLSGYADDATVIVYRIAGFSNSTATSNNYYTWDHLWISGAQHTYQRVLEQLNGEFRVRRDWHKVNSIVDQFGEDKESSISQYRISKSTYHDGLHGYIANAAAVEKLLGEKTSFNDLPVNQYFTFTYAGLKVLSDIPTMSNVSDTNLILVERYYNDIGNGAYGYIYSYITKYGDPLIKWEHVLEINNSTGETRVDYGWKTIAGNTKNDYGADGYAGIAQEIVTETAVHDPHTVWYNSEERVAQLLGDDKDFNKLPTNQFFTFTYTGFKTLSNIPDLSDINGLVGTTVIFVKRFSNCEGTNFRHKYVYSYVTVYADDKYTTFEKVTSEEAGVTTERKPWKKSVNVVNEYGTSKVDPISQNYITKTALHGYNTYVNSDATLPDEIKENKDFNYLPMNRSYTFTGKALKLLTNIPDSSYFHDTDSIYVIRTANFGSTNLAACYSLDIIYQTGFKRRTFTRIVERYYGSGSETFRTWINWTPDINAPTIQLGILGDSISDANFKGDQNWPYGIKKISDYVIQNLAQSGTTLTKREGIGSIQDRVELLSENNNVIVLFGGTNDLWATGTTLGEIDSEDPLTIYGALNIIVNGIMNKCPKAAIVIASPLQRQTDPTTNNLTTKDIAKCCKDICDKYACFFVDLNTRSGFYPKNESNYAAFTEDGIHPNKYYSHNILAKIFDNAIRKAYFPAVIEE